MSQHYTLSFTLDCLVLKINTVLQENNLHTIKQEWDQYNTNEKIYIDGQVSRAKNIALDMGTALGTKIDATQVSVDTLASGSRKFSALRIGPATLQGETNGNFMIDTGTSSSLDLTAKQLTMKSNACIQIGSNTICNTIGGWNATGNWTTSNVITANNYNLSNLNISNKDGNLYVQDLKGVAKGITVNGIKQTAEGKMIDYNGYGLGEFDNGTIRTYAPSLAGSKIAMSFGTTGKFRDVVQVQNATGSAKDQINIAGDVTVTGALNNPSFATAQTQIKSLADNVPNLATTTQMNAATTQIKSISDNVSKMATQTQLLSAQDQIKTLADSVTRLSTSTPTEVTNALTQLKVLQESVTKYASTPAQLATTQAQLKTITDAVNNLSTSSPTGIATALSQIKTLQDTINKLATQAQLATTQSQVETLKNSVTKLNTSTNCISQRCS